MQNLIKIDPLLDAIINYSWNSLEDKRHIESLLLDQMEIEAYTEDEVLNILYEKETFETCHDKKTPVWIKMVKQGIEYWGCPICGQEVQPTVYPRMSINKCPRCGNKIYKENNSLKGRASIPWWKR